MSTHNPLQHFLQRIEEMTIAKKTTLLFVIMLLGMVFIGSFAHVSISRMKHNFDVLYTKRMLPTIRLENIKDIYTVNVLDTVRDIEKANISIYDGKEIIALAKELISRELRDYKESQTMDERDWLFRLIRYVSEYRASERIELEDDILTTKIEQKIYGINTIIQTMFDHFDSRQHSKAIEILQTELYPSVHSINSDLTTLIHLNLEGAKEGHLRTQQVYEETFVWIMLVSLATFFVAAFLAYVLLKNIRYLHISMAHMVEEKTHELQQLNRDLEVKIAFEVEQSRAKDRIMFRQSRLAFMGEMIGNIAHQWRQPLNALVLIIQSFQMKKMAGLEITETFIDKQVNDGMELATMMSRTIDDFRNFFQPDKQAEPFEVSQCVSYSVKLVKEYYDKLGIEIFIKSFLELRIMGYPNEFSQVILNLLGNAKDALVERNIEHKYIEIAISRENDYVVIKVIDNGGGVSDEVLERMFEPYFTTKHQSSGTGIGLYMSKQIIEKQMKGSINASNVAYTFQNAKKYDACAVLTIVVPIEAIEKKE